jgi:hypothetical protein
MRLRRRRWPDPPILIEHCPTCAERMTLFRRGDLDCHIVEHKDALRLLGRAIFERDEAHKLAKHRFELVAILDRRNRAMVVEIERLETRLRHPARGGQAEAA